MAKSQEWCTQCGRRAPRNPRARATWYSVGILTAGSAVLASGAAAAGVAALTQGSSNEVPRRTLVAQTPATTAPGTSTPPTAPVNPGAAETLKVPHGGTSSTLPPTNTPATATTPPSSPAAVSPPAAVHPASTPSPSHTHVSTASSTHSTSTASNGSSNSSNNNPSSASPEPINLTGVSASVYNPYGYPPSAFGKHKRPGETWEPPIKEEPSTAWTVTVKPGTAAHLNVGLAIDLGEARKLGSIEVATPTPGFPLEVRATTSSTPPASIQEWTVLGVTHALKRSETLKLGESGKAFRHLVLWVPSVPERLSQVTISEVTLFEP
jgi:hypothetical protein